METDMKFYKKFEMLIRENNPIALLGSDGSCSCGYLELFGLAISSHCWKTRIGCDCEYSGIHIKDSGNINYNFSEEELVAIGKLFADFIEEAYHTNVEIVIEQSDLIKRRF